MVICDGPQLEARLRYRMLSQSGLNYGLSLIGVVCDGSKFWAHLTCLCNHISIEHFFVPIEMTFLWRPAISRYIRGRHRWKDLSVQHCQPPHPQLPKRTEQPPPPAGAAAEPRTVTRRLHSREWRWQQWLLLRSEETTAAAALGESGGCSAALCCCAWESGGGCCYPRRPPSLQLARPASKPSIHPHLSFDCCYQERLACMCCPSSQGVGQTWCWLWISVGFGYICAFDSLYVIYVLLPHLPVLPLANRYQRRPHLHHRPGRPPRHPEQLDSPCAGVAGRVLQIHHVLLLSCSLLGDENVRCV